MQGAWAVVVRTINGADNPAYRQDLTVEIAGDRIRFLVRGELRTEWAITLDDAKTPKVFDMKLREGRGTIEVGKGPHLPCLGIYRLDGDTLWLSHVAGRNGQPRPTDFEGKRRGESPFLLKRIKP
jgi:uncharacterized protein (TIGR03067 family)